MRRWTYKYEEAARRGALGALIVHEAAGAGYGWSTVIASNGEAFDIVRADPAKEKVLLQGWLQRGGVARTVRRRRARTSTRSKTKGPARRLPSGSADRRQLLGQLRRGARAGRQPQRHRARSPGAKLPNESVMFAAHWDAYGVGAPDAQGRTVRPGALDDAIGVAGTMEIARAFKAGPAAGPHPGVRRLDRPRSAACWARSTTASTRPCRWRPWPPT